MASRVVWRNHMDAPLCQTGMRNLPKKPVIWWGDAFVALRDGQTFESSWRARRPMTVAQAHIALRAVVDELLAELTPADKEQAIDSGFYMECR